MAHGLEQIAAAVARDRVTRRVGRISKIGAGVLHVTNLAQHAALGDQVRIGPHGRMRGEVVRLDDGSVSVLPEGTGDGLRLGHRVLLDGTAAIAPDDGWIGRIIDPYGNALDGRPLLPGPDARPLAGRPIHPPQRRPLGSRMETGL